MPRRRFATVALALTVGLATATMAWPQGGSPAPPRGKGPGPGAADIELVEKLLAARKEYQVTLEQLRSMYISTGDVERAQWAQEELIQFHRIPKQAFRLELDVPPPTLHATTNIPEANELFKKAMLFKDKGRGLDYVDNQKRAELLLQQLLTSYPQSDKIGDAAYQLGDLYEKKPYVQYRRAAAYFERTFQWNPTTRTDARMRAARLYDRFLQERPRAIELYREVTSHETDPKRMAEAEKRLQELSAPARN